MQETASERLYMDSIVINYSDENVWNLICEGKTKGVFQCESGLVQHWLRKIKPRNLWELSAVIALVRPGALESGMAETYAENKKNGTTPSFGHPVIDDIFDTTQGVLCVEENTLVKMADGTLKPIKEVRQWDKLPSLDLKTRKFNIEECHGADQTKKGDGLKLTLYNGLSVTITPDHKIYTFEGWKKAEDLDLENDIVACANDTNCVNSNYIHPDLCEFGDPVKFSYLLGLMLADASMTDTLNIACGPIEKSEIISRWIKKHFKKYVRAWVRESARCTHVHISRLDGQYNNSLRKWIKTHSLNKDCYNKFVPSCILQSNTECKKAFLAGFFDGDGHFSVGNTGGGICHLTTVSKKLLIGLSSILTDLGIDHSNRYKNRIYIYNQLLFSEIVKDYSILKTHVFDSKSYLSDGERWGLLPNSFIASECKNKFPKQYYPSKFVSKFGHPRRYDRIYDDGDIKFFPIAKIEKVTDCTFYDISVSNHHNFIGNGIILSNCYQEALIQLGLRLAWQHLPEMEKLALADNLRKAVGKKNQKKILEIGEKFIQGCDHNEISKEISTKLFEIIKNSGRYLFNLAHSFSYCETAYELAWYKFYHPKEFFTVYLTYAQFKQSVKGKSELTGKWKEIADMIVDANQFGIATYTPSINKWNYHFAIENGNIRYGLGHIKYVSEAVLRNAFSVKPEYRFTHWAEIAELSITDNYGKSLRKNSLIALISVGAFIDVKESRQNLLSLLNFLDELTPKEHESLLPLMEDARLKKLSLKQFKQNLETNNWVATVRKPRIIKVGSQLEMWKTDLVDHAAWIEDQEKYYLGYPISCTRLDEKEGSEHTIQDCLEDAPKGTIKRLHARIAEMRLVKTKTGKNPGQDMAIVVLADYTGELKVPVFPQLFTEVNDLLMPNALIGCELTRGDRDYFVTSVHLLSNEDNNLEFVENEPTN